MSQVSIIDIETNNPQIPTSFQTDLGTAIPIGNVLELLGQNVSGSGIQTSGSGNTVSYRMLSPYSLGGFSFTGGNVDVTKSTNAGIVSTTISNTSNTPGSKAVVDINVAGTSADDPYIRFEINGDGNSQWAMGLDNSDTQAFCLTHSSVLGGLNIFRVDKSSSSTLFQAGNLGISLNSGGGNPTLSVANTSNTVSSNALQQATVAGTSAGDPFTTYTVSGATNWSTGIDNSVFGDPFVISASTALGTSDALSILTNGTITFKAGQVVAISTPGAYPYTTLATDYVIFVDTASARTINLIASPVTGQTYRIKDNVGSGGTNNITISPAAGNIDGSATFVINTNFGSVDLVYTGSLWAVL